MTAVNVAGLLREPSGTSRRLRLRDHYLSLAPDVELAGPLDADLELQRTNRGILVRGRVDAPLRRLCGRCTDAFVEQVSAPIIEEFLPSIDPHTGQPLATPEGDEEARTIDERHEIDLDPVLHDELVLTEPMLSLCRIDCPGLCSGCGRRLDEGSCSCVVDELDPRLAVLASLLERTTGSDLD